MLTRDDFNEYKRDYPVYGTHTATDRYRNEYTERDENPRGTIRTMWHPMTDAAAVAEYGKNISKMFFCIIYDDPGIQYGDVLTLYGDEYEVAGIKRYNTHTRLEVKKKAV